MPISVLYIMSLYKIILPGREDFSSETKTHYKVHTHKLSLYHFSYLLEIVYHQIVQHFKLFILPMRKLR